MLTAPYANIAYAPMKLNYDSDRFIYEYDRYLLPRSRPIYNSVRGRDATAELNSKWKMVDPELYSQQDAVSYPSWADRAPTTLTHNNPSWMQAVMMEMVTNQDDDAVLREAGDAGRLPARNFAPDREWRLKKEFEKLNLTIKDFIFNELCLSKIVWISCVSLEPGRCALIHRDSMRLYTQGVNPMLDNGLARRGYVVITLNISNGGVPLYWSLDGIDDAAPRFADDSIYLSSDYFLHGVPVVSSRRRQIRITGVPGPGFDQMIGYQSAVILPDDYQYQSAEASMY